MAYITFKIVDNKLILGAEIELETNPFLEDKIDYDNKEYGSELLEFDEVD